MPRQPCRKDDVVRTLREHREALARMGVRRLALFGSVARDVAGPESDIDILVELTGKADFDRYMDVKFFLEDLLNARVDLVTPNALKPSLRPRIEKELVDVA